MSVRTFCFVSLHGSSDDPEEGPDPRVGNAASSTSSSCSDFNFTAPALISASITTAHIAVYSEHLFNRDKLPPVCEMNYIPLWTCAEAHRGWVQTEDSRNKQKFLYKELKWKEIEWEIHLHRFRADFGEFIQPSFLSFSSVNSSTWCIYKRLTTADAGLDRLRLASQTGCECWWCHLHPAETAAEPRYRTRTLATPLLSNQITN